jgi:hypothetical protein
MKSILRSALFACVTSAPALAVAQPAAPSIDSLIARHIEARGGAAAMKAISNVEMTGVMRPGGFDADFGYREVIARPGSVRIEATLQGMTPIEAYDGRSGWQVQPFQGRKDPEALSSDDVKSLQEEADFEDALVDYKAKGSAVDDLGEVDVDGGPTWALRVNLKNGDQETFYLDPDSFLTVRVVTRQVVRGAETLNETDFGDYEKVNGVYFPFEVDSGPKGSTVLQRVTYNAIKANVPLDPAIFEEPRPGPGRPVQQSVTPTQPEDASVPPGPKKPGVPAPGAPAVEPAGTPPRS